MTNLDPWTILWWILLFTLSWAIWNEIKRWYRARRFLKSMLEKLDELFPGSWSRVTRHEYNIADNSWYVEIETYIPGRPEDAEAKRLVIHYRWVK